MKNMKRNLINVKNVNTVYSNLLFFNSLINLLASNFMQMFLFGLKTTVNIKICVKTFKVD